MRAESRSGRRQIESPRYAGGVRTSAQTEALDGEVYPASGPAPSAHTSARRRACSSGSVDTNPHPTCRVTLVDGWRCSTGTGPTAERQPHGPPLRLARPTVYRWLARFDRFHLESLEDRSSAPRRRRRPTWTLDQLAAVKAVRETYPRWGKDKLAACSRNNTEPNE